MSTSRSQHSIFGNTVRPTVKRSFSDSSLDGHVQQDLNRRTTSVGEAEKQEDLGPRPRDTSQPGVGETKARERHDGLPLADSVITGPLTLPAFAKPLIQPRQLAGNKRSLSGPDVPFAKNRRAKRPRLQATLNQPNSFNLADLREQSGPFSPLFFSNRRQLRPELPPRFSSSEAAAKMLSRTKGEDSNVKTVTLARGFTSHPNRRHRRSADRSSNDRSSLPRQYSSETPDRPESSPSLHSIGITELLDQDDRPTFVIDLLDGSYSNPDSLPIVFVNNALASCEALLDAVQGRLDAPSSNPLVPRSAQTFREWVLTESVNGETLNGALPAFVQGAVSWSASTLRHRYRVVNGTLLSDESRRASASLISSTLSTGAEGGHPRSPVKGAADGALDKTNPVVLLRYQEAQDYFGNVSPRNDDAGASARNRWKIREIPQTPTSPLTRSGESMRGVDRTGAEPSIESVLARGPISVDDTAVSESIFDWTLLPDSDNMPPHVRFARSIDWGSTSLGPIEDWNADLRQMVNLIMASPHPAAMYWGKDLVAIYNEAYVFLAGQKHPQLMGQKYSDAWAEIWDDVKDVFASATATGQATMKDDDCLFIMRSDVLEETYFSWSIIPMIGGDGTVMGLYNPAFEKTRRKIAERRMLTLREVGERTATARDVKGFWEAVLAALDCNEYDTPFVMLYSLAEDDSSDANSATESSVSGGIRQCYLEGALGVPLGHAAAPSEMDLRAGNEGFAPKFRDAMMQDQALVLDIEEDQELAALLSGLEWRGFGDPARKVVICPIHPTTGENTLGFLAIGVNPRRPYDDDYGLFIQLLSRQLATSLASVVLFEEEIRRGQKAAKMAALDRIELSEQLAARTQEAIESETRFTRMAEFAPVGMFIANSEGEITFCNDTWYDITRVPRSLEFAENWVDYCHSDDMPLVQQTWHDLVDNRKAVSTEFRFKAPWLDRSGATGETWVLFSAYPETDDSGRLKSVFGSVTNISSQKWAEGLQKKKMEEAVELKRQQETFIDMTSHEMRNPLSAILQCADEIVNSLTEARNNKSATGDESLFDTNIDAAQTIALCAQHQKRIVDDVLTMSKIDSALLMVTPVDVQPLSVANRALKMFESELLSADIKMQFKVDDSFEKLGIDWVRFDPSRVMQVLINLTTNAIKFTSTQDRRTILVTLAASPKHPSLDVCNPVKYVPRRANRKDMTQGPDWGNGEEIYISFSVKDTGRGLSDEEKKSLFMRFSQASPRTHVQYGGSGLGLFISRELTEMQGGEIGVASVPGEGSTFAFFVKARKSKAPVDPSEHLPPTLGPRRTSDGKPGSKKISSTKVRDFAAPKAQREQLKVLLVEDNLVNQRVLQKQLTKLDCVVHVANHGREALDKLHTSTFYEGKLASQEVMDIRVVLMDQEMPVLDGISATKRIREMELAGKFTKHVPILGITANARQEQIQQLIEAGMDDVVSKPFRIQEVIPKIEELTAKYWPTTTDTNDK